MTSTLRVTASNKFTLFDVKTRQIAVRNAFWKGSFVRIVAFRCALYEGQLCGQNRPLRTLPSLTQKPLAGAARFFLYHRGFLYCGHSSARDSARLNSRFLDLHRTLATLDIAAM